MDRNEAINLKTDQLSNLQPGFKALIYDVEGGTAFKKRIAEMGFLCGNEVKVIKSAPLQDPIEYEIMGYRISLRKKEAALIKIIPHKTKDNYINVEPIQTLQLPTSNTDKVLPAGRTIKVALIGNPNTGKTTFFNHASGAKEKVSNYAGVTVDIKKGKYTYQNNTFEIVDLPGIYSLTEYSPEELYVRKYIIEENPDIIINIADATNLNRNLYLTTQLVDMGKRMVVALNMFDELKQRNLTINTHLLEQELGLSIIPTIAEKGHGITEVFAAIIQTLQQPEANHYKSIHLGEHVEKSIQHLQQQFENDTEISKKHNLRYLSIRLLEDDEKIESYFNKSQYYKDIIATKHQEISRLQTHLQNELSIHFITKRYAYIQQLVQRCIQKQDEKHKVRNLDNILTHTIWGIPIFIGFIYLTFLATFTLGSYPMDWIDSAVGIFSETLANLLPDGSAKDLLIDGIIAGVGGVIIFLPNILILFCCLSIMEDTGYMARAAFIMDRLMSKIGLHGKAFIPLIMGFGCNVPAVMATRTIENPKDRLKTLFMVPFMSCSARLPVYVLFISVFFANHQASVLLAIYSIGIIMALMVGLFFNKSMVSEEQVPFIMELPPYRMPTLKNTVIQMWQKSKQYLNKMGTVILFASIIIWALGYFPRDIEYSTDYSSCTQQVQENSFLSPTEKETKLHDLDLSKREEHLEKSYIGQLGHWISPVLAPLGFDWKMGVSIITGMAAKEIVVSSMGVLYHAEVDADENSDSLKDKLLNRTFLSGPHLGQKIFTPLTAFSFMIFILLYFPCFAVIAALAKEAGWLRAIATAGFTTLVAWFVCLYIYQVGNYLMS